MKTKSILTLSVLSVMFTACDDQRHVPQTGQSTITEMEQTETNHQRLARAIPPPQLNDSQERRNLVRRLQLVNDPNRISFIYLLSANGNIVFYSSVRGKVSSLNSMLTTSQQVVTTPMPVGTYTQNVIESPDFDGTYGENPHGVFWFTEDGTYMEWNGTYFISDRPTRLTQDPIMVMQVNGQGNAVAPPTPPANR